ncbi:MAG: glycosyltransferase [Nitrospirota bacterium]|nr:glycosyltransferase [Nitrospirota bacterium]
MKLPRISIVTPSYNQGEFLKETIESVLNQNYPDLEYFIVDGGSTDNSIDIIREYEDHIDWWVSEKDDGQSDAIHKGFSRATGNLLGWLNSDDVYFPGALQRIGEAYAMKPGASIYSGGTAIGKKGNKGIRKCSIPTAQIGIFSRYGIIGVGQQSSFFDADAYHHTGGIDHDIHMRMDGNLMFRLIQHNPATVVMNDMIGFFRWHEGSKSSLSADKFIPEKKQFIESLGTSELRLEMRTMLFRIYRLLTGGYLKSLLATYRYYGMSMENVWENARHGLNEKHP